MYRPIRGDTLMSLHLLTWRRETLSTSPSGVPLRVGVNVSGPLTPLPRWGVVPHTDCTLYSSSLHFGRGLPSRQRVRLVPPFRLVPLFFSSTRFRVSVKTYIVFTLREGQCVRDSDLFVLGTGRVTPGFQCDSNNLKTLRRHSGRDMLDRGT